ncbi:hypothetical protein B0T19DRAFT_285415 [Cercophora scortea]|uniref:Uncharacterized protein n=1 Tax=Cercophora scortea TaxID=314031 RepID=A0AAE0M6F8_9PEZI|nr:hypothetical protein B0T19DRAFT_285415 [Cercophora scortea]
MGLNLLDRLQAKIELFRLEQRYTRRRHRRSTFVSNATYVDGEYIYNSPNTTGSSANTSRTNNSQTTDNHSSAVSSPSTSSPPPVLDPVKAQKRLNRWSSMPGFGSMSKSSSPQPPVVSHDWRTARASYER